MNGVAGPKGRDVYGGWRRWGSGAAEVIEITARGPRSGCMAWNRPPH